MFAFNIESSTLTIDPKYEKSITLGLICPGQGNKLTFELNSNVLGKSTKTYDITTPDASSVSKNITVFNF